MSLDAYRAYSMLAPVKNPDPRPQLLNQLCALLTSVLQASAAAYSVRFKDNPLYLCAMITRSV